MQGLIKTAIITTLLLSSQGLAAPSSNDNQPPTFNAKTFEALKMRHIGPAYMSGRIADIAVDQNNPNIWYTAVGSGGVWKTDNAGTTWQPIFDKQAVYSTGDVTIDPSNSNIIWVGTGENNGGRHISFGDGIYKSLDGGTTWQNMSLAESEHISDIIVHPTDSNIVWAAVQGPLWTSGGERGVYKTTDGGKKWSRVLIPEDEWTGVTSLLIDPTNPDRLYAATWARQRTIAAYVGTGPGAGIFTSEDGGETWTELKTGLPEGNMGKIGMAISPKQPEVLYATIETDNRAGGFYRSANHGVSWEQMSDEIGAGTGPHYYQEIFADPHQFDRVYIASNYSKVSDDGGKTWTPINTDRKHVDDHAFAFHPTDPDFVLIGSDGGIYMSHDRMANWRYIANLPLAQFYKVAPDDSSPFYMIYGGTQDNSTQGGPSRTRKKEGIKNKDWFLTLGGDGHQPATEPGNPNILYGQSQQGNLARHDLNTRENVNIRPQPRPGEPAERYNWDAPINVSAHDPKRLYFASQRVWRSDDRGDSWTPVSGDLTKNGNRMHRPMMGRPWSVEAGWDLYAMSEFHTIANFAESPIDEDILWIGTDDGLIQVTTDGGKSWRKIDLSDIRGIPSTAYVNDIRADLFDPDTVYVALDNHKYGDFKPYLIKTTNLGKKWTSLAQSLPDKHLVWRIVQDHENKNLLFIGTEFGVFFTVDGGKNWVELDGGMPTISTRDVKIQRRENDLVAGTFGRGIYILDDYAPLRVLTPKALQKEALLFAPSRPVKWYREDTNHSSSDGNDRFVAENPPFGATLTYYLKDSLLTAKQQRQQAEKDMLEKEKYPTYPSWEAIEQENQEAEPAVYIEIRDENENVVNRVPGDTTKGIHRITWDMTYAKSSAVTGSNISPWHPLGNGVVAPAGTYTAALFKRIGSEISPMAAPVTFKLQAMYSNSIEGPGDAKVLEFGKDLVAAERRLSAVTTVLSALPDSMALIRSAIDRTPGKLEALEARYADIQTTINRLKQRVYGLESRNRMGIKPANINSRLQFAMTANRSSYGPTQQHIEQFGYAQEGLDEVSSAIKVLQQQTIPALQEAINKAGGPWTPNAPVLTH
ncbi:MAG: glycosyl hydrolase [Alteromonadaceae bacterium]|nr:glycosyl hydrolase [Alteromonadaceae bacterium]